jgi:hypothetical protein
MASAALKSPPVARSDRVQSEIDPFRLREARGTVRPPGAEGIERVRQPEPESLHVGLLACPGDVKSAELFARCQPREMLGFRPAEIAPRDFQEIRHRPHLLEVDTQRRNARHCDQCGIARMTEIEVARDRLRLREAGGHRQSVTIASEPGEAFRYRPSRRRKAACVQAYIRRWCGK